MELAAAAFRMSLRADPFWPYCILNAHTDIEFVFHGSAVSDDSKNSFIAEDKAQPGPLPKGTMKTDTQARWRDVNNTPRDC